MKFSLFLFSNNNKNLKRALLLLLLIQAHLNSPAQVIRPVLTITLLLNTNGGIENTADGVMAFYDDHFSKGIGNEDSYKFTNPDENLAINRNGTLLSIEGRPVIHGNDTLLLQMWKFRQKTYFLKFIATNFSADLTAVLRDQYLKKDTIIDLTSETFVPFSLTTDTSSYAPERFCVLFKMKNVLPEFMPVKNPLPLIGTFSVFPNPVKGNIINLKMNNMKKGKYAVNLYNSAGKTIYSGSFEYAGGSSTKTIAIDKRVYKGIYRLQLSFEGVNLSRLVLFE